MRALFVILILLVPATIRGAEDRAPKNPPKKETPSLANPPTTIYLRLGYVSRCWREPAQIEVVGPLPNPQGIVRVILPPRKRPRQPGDTATKP